MIACVLQIFQKIIQGSKGYINAFHMLLSVTRLFYKLQNFAKAARSLTDPYC